MQHSSVIDQSADLVARLFDGVDGGIDRRHIGQFNLHRFDVEIVTAKRFSGVFARIAVKRTE